DRVLALLALGKQAPLRILHSARKTLVLASEFLSGLGAPPLLGVLRHPSRLFPKVLLGLGTGSLLGLALGLLGRLRDATVRLALGLLDRLPGPLLDLLADPLGLLLRAPLGLLPDPLRF